MRHWVDPAFPLSELNTLGYAVGNAVAPLSPPSGPALVVLLPADAKSQNEGATSAVKLIVISAPSLPPVFESRLAVPSSATYVIQMNTGVVDSPVTAIGSKTGEAEVTGIIRVPGIADLYGSASKDPYGVRFGNVADLLLLATGLGGGVKVFAVSRAAIHTAAVGQDVHVAIEPGAGVGIDVPAGAGDVLRVKVSAGPDIAVGDGKPSVLPAAALSAEIVF